MSVASQIGEFGVVDVDRMKLKLRGSVGRRRLGLVSAIIWCFN